MRANNYLNADLQKAFSLQSLVWQAKLAAVIKSARRRKSLAISWLDIANAYGSVHHSLIQFSLAHYHAPPEFSRLLQSWYTGLSATISANDWSIDPVPLRIGVYQGDPLSVVIFLTVINTLSDSLCTRRDLGFTLSRSSTTINHLLCARVWKRAKYQDLVESGRAAGYKTELITFEVGSRGMLGDSVVEGFKKAIKATQKDISSLCLLTIRSATILGSFAIWTSRNSIT